MKKTQVARIGKPLRMPDAKSFDDIFEAWVPGGPIFRPDHPAPRPFEDTPLHNTNHFKLGTYCAVSRKAGHSSLCVKPREETVRAVGAFTITIDYDEMYFEIIDRGDNEALVVAKYNQIIGSVWLALIDSSTIPIVAED